MTPAAVTTQTQRGGRAPARKCGATKRGHGKGSCGRGAGWGTDHPGFGNCKLHGGSTPSGKASAAKEAALASARAEFGGDVDVDPLEALLWTVRRGAQLAVYWQRAALTADTAEAFTAAAVHEARALGDLSRWSKNAVDAGVAERQVRLAERMGETIVAAAEEALEALEQALGKPLTDDERTAFAVRFGAVLSRHEAGTVETTAHDG